ncbi:hypothetical protein LEP1GSC188_0530 [Leptospira weilii serovar Topaz str. LT2116]|uniref:Uncharacterized protein n=1 Tax=Leptospira weilii serovar Topaz str. LT2116 TaxID=1088540 RepID=M3EQ75_9LEPT|nr:hypothetical protein LEP1GSC188_0530 [Leptospira weilii serovar Topaz str. LT2116]
MERFGQDACGGYTNSSFYYHNSFLIADFRNAFVLKPRESSGLGKGSKVFIRFPTD